MSQEWSVMRPIKKSSNMPHVWILAFLCVSFLGSSVQDGLAQGVRLDFGGRIIELADGNVTDSLAKEVISYSRNLYERAAYSKTERYLSALISRYDGVELGNAHFLRGKARFMDNSRRGAYNDFLTLFDGYRDSPPVRSGDLKVTISNGLDRIVKLANLSDDKCCQDIDVSRLDIMMMFYELYKYVSGEPSLEKMEQVLATKYTRKRKITSLSQNECMGRVRSCYTVNLGRDSSSISDIPIAMLLADVAMDEWNYMKLLMEDLCGSGYAIHHPVLPLGKSVTLWANGEELGKYDNFLSRVRKLKPREFTVKVNGKAAEFKLRGPLTWKYRGLHAKVAWPGVDFGHGHEDLGYMWSDDSYIGPVEVDFVVRDLIEARHGSVGEWVGLRKTRDQL